MVKLKWLKEWRERKPGDVSNVAKKSAENFVSQGYAEYIEEPEENKISEIELKIKEFEKFYYFLMKKSPKGYTPWFFPCDKNGKNPSPLAIMKLAPQKSLCCDAEWVYRITKEEEKQLEANPKLKVKPQWRCDECEKTKGSWHGEHARLSKEQCIQHIKQNFNLGISARTGDPLIIIDIDEEQYLNQIPKDTLTTRSRKRAGLHAFCWDKDGSAKINLPTEGGEIRSKNQYVLSPGSSVHFDFASAKDAKAYLKLPEWAQDDELLGYYTVEESISPRPITFNEFPQFFKDKEEENIKAEANIKQNDERKEYPSGGKYEELNKLKVSDIIDLIPPNKRVGHPLHESDTDANWSMNADGSLGHCWRHLVSLNAVQYLCVKVGYAKCGDAGTPHKGRGLSKIKGDKKALEAAYKEAVKMGLIKEWEGKKTEGINQQTTIFRQLAMDFYQKQPYFYDSAKLWWMWNNKVKCWEVKDEVDIMNQFDNYFVQESEKSNIKSGIIEALKKYGRKNQPKEIKQTWVQFKKNIYDINNDDIFEATPEYFVANPIPWEIGENEDTPLIDKLFTTWVRKEDIPKLYELIAFSIVPEMFIHSFWFLFSPPGMGKGTFVNLLLNFIGRNNAVSTSISRINANPRFETYCWHKKLLITMGEVSKIDNLKNSGLINQATGGEPIRAEVKNGGGFDFVNYGKFIYPTNKLLKVEPEDGFGRRARTIKFRTRFEKEKDVLSEISNEEYENLAKKCLRIAKELYKKRRFTGDVNISERMNNYQEESKTSLERFIDNHCDIEDFEEKVTLDEFFSNYSKFLKREEKGIINKSELAKSLKRLGWETRRISLLTAQYNLDGSQKRELINHVIGIKIISVISVKPKIHLAPYVENEWKQGVQGDKGDNKDKSQRELDVSDVLVEEKDKKIIDEKDRKQQFWDDPDCSKENLKKLGFIDKNEGENREWYSKEINEKRRLFLKKGLEYFQLVPKIEVVKI